ncbi:hypothetical protein DSUL_30036 [Desulfovibrionales bacterium]
MVLAILLISDTAIKRKRIKKKFITPQGQASAIYQQHSIFDSVFTYFKLISTRYAWYPELPSQFQTHK